MSGAHLRWFRSGQRFVLCSKRPKSRHQLPLRRIAQRTACQRRRRSLDRRTRN